MRLHYADEVRLVVVKQKVWEDSVAHPKHARAERGTGGATEKLVVDHCRHDGVGCRRRRCSGVYSGGTDQLKGHRALEQHGKDKSRLERSRKLSELAGHDKASSTALRPAARKKGDAQHNPVKLGA